MLSIGAVVLAAGGSTRMGSPKQLLRYGDRTLLRHAVESALGLECGPVAVVLGAHADRLSPELAGLDVLSVLNADWERGMGTSIRAGLSALLAAPGGELDAVLILLCDQPIRLTETLRAVVCRYCKGGAPLVVADYGETLGPPALFSRTLFAELMALPDEQGARQIIRRHCELATTVPYYEGVADIDTPDDYERLKGTSAI